MPPRGVKMGTKRARRYEKVKKSERRAGESRQRSRSAPEDLSSGQRGGRRSSSTGPRGRTNEARRLGIDGRSKMDKSQPQRSLAGKKS